MAVVLTKVGSFQLFGRHSSAKRHQTHIDEVGAARTAKVGMCEAVDNVFIVIIALARIPSDQLFRLWTQLYHALRHGRAWEGTAAKGTCLVGLRPDEGIHILSVVVGALCAQE